MQRLEALAAQARALGAGAISLSSAENELARQLQICNACRYCEGYCAVFPAMTRRLEFGKADIHYLANLCHNCGACLHACQYAPPHAFAVNVPQAMARVRGQTYADFAWPAPLGVLYQRNGLTLALALAAGLVLFLALAAGLNGSLFQAPITGNFYSVFPHKLLVSMFAPVFVFALLALALGVRRFWLAIAPGPDGRPAPALPEPGARQSTELARADPAAPDAGTRGPVVEAGLHALLLTHLGGGHGEGCNNADDAWTLWRRRFHHATFYGFLLCFAATCVATLYHYLLGQVAPYALPSLPKLLGVSGGVGLLVGTVGLFWLNLQRHPRHGDAAQKPMDLGFIALLFLTSLSGMLLWLGRGTGALPALLALHLGAVMALFATLPYGKFAHGVFRCAALLRCALERRQPNRLQLGPE